MNMETGIKLGLISGIEKFPIGGSFSECNLERMDYLTAKAAIIAYLARTEEGLNEDSVRDMLSSALDTSLPFVSLAESKLGLSAGFIEDYGKVQLIRESDKSYDEMMELIRKVAETYGYTGGMSK